MEIVRLDAVQGVPGQEGLTRRVLSHSPQLMLVHNTIEAGSVLPMHKHPHQQILYVQSGELRLHCEGQEERTMRTGDSCAIPGDVPHGVLAVTDLIVLDIFTPAREDFLAQ